MDIDLYFFGDTEREDKTKTFLCCLHFNVAPEWYNFMNTMPKQII